MNPVLRRLVVTIAVLGLAGAVVLVMVLGPKRQPLPAAGAAAQTEAAAAPEQRPIEAASTSPAEATPAPEQPTAPPPQPIEGLHAAWAAVGDGVRTLGSLDPRRAGLYLELSPAGAGIERITLSGYWQTAAQSRRAVAHYEALEKGDPDPPPLPPESGRYVLQTAQPFSWFDSQTSQWRELSIPLLAAHTVVINGKPVPLLTSYTDDDGVHWSCWAETASGVFEATIVDGEEQPIALINRSFVLGDDFDLTIDQHVTNLTDASMDVQWIQYGPGDLTMDRSRYMDRRRFRFGYLPDARQFPDLVASDDNDLILEQAKVAKNADKARTSEDPLRRLELVTLWPNETSRSRDYVLSWFASSNRYFGFAVYPPLDRSLQDVVSEIRTEVSGTKESAIVFTALYSPTRNVAPEGMASFDLGVYAGPLDPEVLAEKDPMAALRMQGLILYQMSSFCAICTFQWLAHGLLWFLSVVHFVVRDWGVAIILLVIVVRTLLHPLTKRAQINMQRFGKVMSELKPEIDKLQKKYPNEPKKLQAEQMKMMRERGVNPFQMLGCLPMVLQMPIWVALYATLYFAFELRHQPAFWGFFQLFWEWPFLADLSAADHFFWEFLEPFKFLMWNVTGVNLLPILLGIVFFIQQKYMSPPPSPSMTPEQMQQQKIMKVLMVVMFPVMLYSAPSGLTLYICTSSFLGIIESRYVRQHIKEMDLNPAEKTKKKAKKKPKDLQARAYASAVERAKAKRKPPPKRYKKRK